MDRRLGIVALLVISVVVVAIIIVDQPRTVENDDRIYQIGTLDGLLRADFDGKISVSELLDHGEYGLGTFEGLDGEMVVIDRTCYRVANDGSVNRVDGSTMTPFASVTDLEGAAQITIDDASNFTVLREQLLSGMDEDMGFALIIIHANFTELTVRSVPGQVPPYPPLMDVLADQSVYHLSGVTGTLVGFYSPSYVGTIDQAGFHFHFISDDRSLGGHLLDVELIDAKALIDQKIGLVLDL